MPLDTLAVSEFFPRHTKKILEDLPGVVRMMKNNLVVEGNNEEHDSDQLTYYKDYTRLV